MEIILTVIITLLLAMTAMAIESQEYRAMVGLGSMVALVIFVLWVVYLSPNASQKEYICVEYVVVDEEMVGRYIPIDSNEYTYISIMYNPNNVMVKARKVDAFLTMQSEWEYSVVPLNKSLSCN